VAFNVVTISGSLRKRSFNTALMRSLPALALADLDLSEAPPYDRMPLYNADIQSVGFPADVITFADAIRNADGVIIVSPEYNWTIPGGLKNALDWVSRLENQPFRDKPVAIQSATGGPIGGARMQYHLRMALTFLNATIFGTPEVFVGACSNQVRRRRAQGQANQKGDRRPARGVRQIHCTRQGLVLLEWRDQPSRHHPWPVWRIEEQRHADILSATCMSEQVPTVAFTTSAEVALVQCLCNLLHQFAFGIGFLKYSRFAEIH
jgi:chromate reductase, NAD(P)H dehydrogenase (quinone)